MPPRDGAQNDENAQSAQDPLPPNYGYGDDGYGAAQNPQNPMPPNNGGQNPMPPQNSGGYGVGQNPQNPQNPMPPNNGYGYGQAPSYGDGEDENTQNGAAAGGFDQFRGIGNAEESEDGSEQRIFAANIDED